MLTLFYEFFLIGLFAMGGGMATIPFLYSLAERRDWFTVEDLTRIMAISEMTPGPIGVNMATYVGYLSAGVVGSLVVTLALVLPSFLIILVLAKFTKKLKEDVRFLAVFETIRPVSLGLVTAVLLRFAAGVFWGEDGLALGNVVVFLLVAIVLFLPQTKKVPIPLLLVAAAGAGFFLL